MLALGARAAAAQRVVGQAARLGGVRHSSRSCGLVGLANVGKSTLFNGLVKQQLSQAANYPFCTIDPCCAAVEPPDERLKKLQELAGSQRRIGHQIEYHDIAGLIKGAHKGEGLGNAFLGNIRAVDAILQVVRCFSDPEIIHVMEGPPDAVRDIVVLENELALADLQSIEKRLGTKGKAARTAEGAATNALLERAREVLEAGKPARVLDATIAPADLPTWRKLQLLTQKPILYVLNVGEEDAATGNAMTRAVEAHLAETTAAAAATVAAAAAPPPPTPAGAAGAGAASAAAAAASSAAPVLAHTVVCAKLESEAAQIADEAERLEFLRAYGLERSGLDAIQQQTARLLRQQKFYTVGPAEARAWVIPAGATAVEASGAIHTDFVKGFIRAEVIPYDDFVACGGEKGAKDAGKVQVVGKEHVMRDGDVVVFRIGNVSGGGKA